MKQAIAVAAFVLAGIPCAAHAQAGDSQSIIKPAPAQKPAGSANGASAAEGQAATNLIDQAEEGTALAGAVANCSAVAAKAKELTSYAKALKKTEDFLGVLGNVLSTVSIGTNISHGNTEGLIDDAQGLLITKGGCLYFGPFCPVYEFGMSVGTIINYAPKVFYWDINEPTLNETMTLYWAERWGDFKYGVNDEAKIRARIEQTRADIRKASADAQRAQAQSLICKTAEEKKSAVQELLAKAKANAAAARMTPVDSGLSAQTDAAINAGRAGADGAIAAGNAQLISTMQAAQQQALQEQALRAKAAQQASKMPFCNGWKEDGYHPCEGTIAYPDTSAPKATVPAPSNSQSSEDCVLTAADEAQGIVCIAN